MKTVAIVCAAGSGKRLGYKTAKPYIRLGNKPLVVYSLLSLQKAEEINKIILVAEEKELERAKRVVRQFGISKVSKIVSGGATRSESVRNGLAVIGEEADFILIHDGVRPFISPNLIKKCLKEAIHSESKAVISAVPCASTIKSADKNLHVVATLDRNTLWQVQTPQVFSRQLLVKAYAGLKTGRRDFFDDAALVEKLPYKVKIVQGENINIKITTREDLKIARALLKTV